MLSQALVNRGLVYESMQLLGHAKKDIELAIEFTDENKSYYQYCLGRVKVAMGQYDRSVTDISYKDEDKEKNLIDAVRKRRKSRCPDRQHSNTNEPDTETEQVSVHKENSYEDLFYKALADFETEEFQGALKTFEAAFGKTTDKSKQADNLFRRGLCYYQLHDLEKAKELFVEALKYEEQSRIFFRLAMINVHESQLTSGLRNLHLAHKLAPGDPDVLHMRADVLEKLGKFDEAIRDRRQIINMSQSLTSQIMEFEDRIKKLKCEISERGDSASSRWKLGVLQQAIYEAQKKSRESDNTRYREAMEELKKAVALDKKGDFPEVRGLLAICQSNEKDHWLANDAFGKLFELFEQSSKSLSMWSLFLERMNDPKYWEEIGANLSDIILKKLSSVENHRLQITKDEEEFKKDKTLWLFYRKFYKQLSNVLAAFALASCPGGVIKHNLEGPMST